MDEDAVHLIALVHQLANALLVQTRKLEEVKLRVEKLEYQRTVNAVGTTFTG